jgi:DNA-binding MarR family transcriptional regulator
MAASVRRLEDPPGSAFLLAALGAHAAASFAERIAALDLTPPQTGLLRAIAATPGQSQQALAQLLGTPPSRLVGLVDSLADRGLVERRRNPADRRRYDLLLTDSGRAALAEAETVATKVETAFFDGLDESERVALQGVLARIIEGRWPASICTN